MAALTPRDFLELGLGFTKGERWQRRMPHIQEGLFRGHFGASTKTCCALWNSLADELNGESLPSHLLLSLRWIWSYDTEHDLSHEFDLDEKVLRGLTKLYIRKIQGLKATTVSTVAIAPLLVGFPLAIPCSNSLLEKD
jgi:hypothetical protein